MSEPSQEIKEKYSCVEGKELYICDLCGLLFCSEPILAPKVPFSNNLIVHKCYACRAGGLK